MRVASGSLDEPTPGFVTPQNPAGRPQDPATLNKSLALLETAGFDVLNLDLIYGIPNQTMESWRQSLEETVRINLDRLKQSAIYGDGLLERIPTVGTSTEC